MRPSDWLNIIITVFLQNNPRIGKYIEEWMDWLDEFEELSFWECQMRILPFTIVVFAIALYY
jgi:hypothetical protein